MKPSYSKYDPKGWCGDPKRGAALGRPTIIEVDPETFKGRVYLSRIVLREMGDYDVNGTYFGAGDPLYWCALHSHYPQPGQKATDADAQDIDFMLRAKTRDEAKRKVLEKLPGARFWR